MVNLLFLPLLVIIGLVAAIVGPWLFGKIIPAKITAVNCQFEKISGAIENYHDSYKNYPERLEDLDLDCIKDPFSDSGEHYIYKMNNGEILLYSRGPDGDDDQGLVEYDCNKGEKSNGDIIIRFAISTD